MHEDEEALTDIDPEPPRSSQGVVTPTKTTSFLSTPPSTVKRDRYESEQDREGYSRSWLDGANDQLDVSKSRKSKMTPFDMWQRTKPGMAKRTLDAVEKAVDAEIGSAGKGKRAKSGH